VHENCRARYLAKSFVLKNQIFKGIIYDLKTAHTAPIQNDGRWSFNRQLAAKKPSTIQIYSYTQHRN